MEEEATECCCCPADEARPLGLARASAFLLPAMAQFEWHRLAWCIL